MPIDPDTGAFARVWQFIDRFQAGEEIMRADLDAALDDFVPAINAALTVLVAASSAASAAAASAEAAAEAGGASGASAGATAALAAIAPSVASVNASLQLVEALVEIASAARSQINDFSKLAEFDAWRESGDFWSEGSIVRAGPITVRKRQDTTGALVWVADQTDPARALDRYLGAHEGAVNLWHIKKIAASSILGNSRGYEAAPEALSVQDALTLLGFAWYGDTASGGMDIAQSTDAPNAPTGLRSGHGTSSAGETTVTFAEAFAASVPNVVVTPIGTSASDDLHVLLTEAPTTAGFKFVIRNAAGAAVARSYSYIAMANGTTL